MTTLPRCADCAFWDNHGDETRKGDCKKRAPIGVKEPGFTTTYPSGERVVETWNVRAKWPLTSPADFCGEFERKEQL